MLKAFFLLLKNSILKAFYWNFRSIKKVPTKKKYGKSFLLDSLAQKFHSWCVWLLKTFWYWKFSSLFDSFNMSGDQSKNSITSRQLIKLKNQQKSENRRKLISNVLDQISHNIFFIKSNWLFFHVPPSRHIFRHSDNRNIHVSIAINSNEQLSNLFFFAICWFWLWELFGGSWWAF